MRFLILSSILLLGPAPVFANLACAFFLGPCEGRERRDSIGIAEGGTYLLLFEYKQLTWIRRQERGQ